MVTQTASASSSSHLATTSLEDDKYTDLQHRWMSLCTTRSWARPGTESQQHW